MVFRFNGFMGYYLHFLDYLFFVRGLQKFLVVSKRYINNYRSCGNCTNVVDIYIIEYSDNAGRRGGDAEGGI